MVLNRAMVIEPNPNPPLSLMSFFPLPLGIACSFVRPVLLGCVFALAALAPVRAQEPAPSVSVEPPAAVAADETSTALSIPGVPLTERFAQGGLTMYVLLGLSFVMVTFGVERLVNLRRKTVTPEGLADKVRTAWKNGDMDKVIAAADAQPSVLASAVTVLAKHRHVTGNDASAMAGDEVSRMMRRHLQKAYPLAIVATLSPLLGLLGTVTGMIDAFEVVAIAGSLGDASMLAGGIAKALITTAFGLIVAIPALGLYHHYRGKTHELALEVEEELNELLREWFHADTRTPASHS